MGCYPSQLRHVPVRKTKPRIFYASHRQGKCGSAGTNNTSLQKVDAGVEQSEDPFEEVGWGKVLLIISAKRPGGFFSSRVLCTDLGRVRFGNGQGSKWLGRETGVVSFGDF